MTYHKIGYNHPTVQPQQLFRFRVEAIDPTDDFKFIAAVYARNAREGYERVKTELKMSQALDDHIITLLIGTHSDIGGMVY